MVNSQDKPQHFNPKPTNVQHDDYDNELPPKNLYDMDAHEIEPEEDELSTESELH